MNTRKTVKVVLGFLVIAASVLAGGLISGDAMENTAAFTLCYSMFAALIPLLAKMADDDQRRERWERWSAVRS